MIYSSALTDRVFRLRFVSSFVSAVLCADRVGQMTKTYSDIDAVTRLLEEVRTCGVKTLVVHADCEALWLKVIIWSEREKTGKTEPLHKPVPAVDVQM